ncbi:MAG: Methylation site containing protein [Candidatus Woesebacteria bacterium GW2011_GWC2_45_9]|uniref:Methylation site containing protein n=2 Tax=Microgenomates group TaxID=1794810 RepID=A0A0G1QFL6_9BACT|nr:MAG: Methylation site containing protein [Candidatus Curtissbacteria bacterium GW2011_GWC1_44_33]KKU16558.1 MAG: Methylation site containing protein [Candidatus Woesebacteria bacterium GW2011_GWC2_45_9]
MDRKHNAAYTLIEILVALTIVGLIFGIGYVNFRDFARRQALAGTARSVMGDSRLAQGQALAGKKPASVFCDPPNRLNGYNFRVNSTSSYQIEAACSGGNVVTKSATLPADISISTPFPNPILFKILGEGTNLSADATIILTQTGTSNTRSITVTQGGEIK